MLVLNLWVNVGQTVKFPNDGKNLYICTETI